MWFFPIFVYVFENTVFEKKIKAMNDKLLVRLPQKFRVCYAILLEKQIHRCKSLLLYLLNSNV